MSKAFDRVNHDRLISKLWNIGVRGNVLSIITSYLRDHSQAVRFNDCVSLPIKATSGVPQGCHLGPILFCVFINDLASCIRCVHTLLYSVDVKIYYNIRSAEDITALQSDLDILSRSSEENGLPLNTNKCCVISFSHKKNPLSFDYFINCAIESPL